MRSLMTCTPHPIFFGEQIKKNERGECNPYGGDWRFMPGFGGDT